MRVVPSQRIDKARALAAALLLRRGSIARATGEANIKARDQARLDCAQDAKIASRALHMNTVVHRPISAAGTCVTLEHRSGLLTQRSNQGHKVRASVDVKTT